MRTNNMVEANLNVFCVCRLEFFSEVRVCLQNLDHLSQISVVVQPCVLQQFQIQLDLKQNRLYENEELGFYHVLLLHFLFRLLVGFIALDGHRPSGCTEREQQQPDASQHHPPSTNTSKESSHNYLHALESHVRQRRATL